MTGQQFVRAVEIQKRLEALDDTKKRIEGTSHHRLYFAEKDCDGDFRCCPDWSMRPIAKLLDKHDLMIRQEIEEEIANLQKEIEKL